MKTQKNQLENKNGADPIARAIEFGIDITLLQENLKLTPTQRIYKAQQVLDSIVALQAEVRAFRARQNNS